MADRDPMKRNAEIVERLKKSDEFIQSGLTDKPKTERKPDTPAAPRTAASTSSRSRKR